MASGIRCSWPNTFFSPRSGQGCGQHIGFHYVYLKHNGVGEGEMNYMHVAMVEIS